MLLTRQVQQLSQQILKENCLHTNQQIKRYKDLMINVFLHREKNQQKSYNLDSLWIYQIRQYRQNFSTSLSEQIMNRQKLLCSMEVCGVQ